MDSSNACANPAGSSPVGFLSPFFPYEKSHAAASNAGPVGPHFLPFCQVQGGGQGSVEALPMGTWAPQSPLSTGFQSPPISSPMSRSSGPASPLGSPLGNSKWSPTWSSPSPVVVEQWQTVGQRLASVFQDDTLWATTPTSSPASNRPAPR